jgi:hypothetical protein
LEEQAFENRRRPNNSTAPQHLPPVMLQYDPTFRRYRHRTFPIAGLPEDWEASVCPITGVVLFEHLPTGTKQNQVPPGFADALADTTTSSDATATATATTAASTDMEESCEMEDKEDEEEEDVEQEQQCF